MKCYYEVLGLARDANEDEIKKAYRKMALQWHPDKNLDNLEEAKVQFQLVQQAYEVLGDHHERAWYDKHRESIIRGAAGNTYKDESIDLFQYFTSSCYSGFGDDDKGFYSVYKEVFNKIAAEDSDFDSDLDSDFEIPSFGKSDSSFDEVVNLFYSYWQDYSTKKSYAWLNTYDIREAPNRKVARLMEKENKKVRSLAKKERNEEVRALVLFVKKRDKRVQAHALLVKEKKDNNLKKSEHHRREQIKERRKEIANHQESEWSKYSNLEKELLEIENKLAAEFGDVSEEDKSSDDEETQDFLEKPSSLYCVACNKVFKTTKAFQNHENSKKHKENLALLKKSDFCFENEPSDSESISSEDSNDPVVDKISHCSLHSDEETNSSNSDQDDSKSLSDQATAISEEKLKTEISPEDLNTTDSVEEDNKLISNKDEVNVKSDTEPENLIDFLGQSKRQKKKMVQKKLLVEKTKSNNRGSNNNTETLKSEEDQNEKSSLKTKKSKIKNNMNSIQKQKENGVGTSEADIGCPQDSVVGPNKEKSKLFNSVGDSKTDSTSDILCNTCSAIFPSKNKLFEHLKKTGHALIKTGCELDHNIVGRSGLKNKSKKKHAKAK